MTSFYFQGIRKCFLEISKRLEVLLAALFYQCLQQIPKEDFLSAFCDWVRRLQKCVSVKGEYFEGLYGGLGGGLFVEL